MAAPHKSSPTARESASAAVYMHVGDLRPNPRNPRLHGNEVAALARTILRTAWGAPIVAQARGRRIIGGHGRLEAAKLILRGIEVDGEMRGGADHRFDPAAPEPGMVPVRLVDVGDAEADAMTVADNATGLQGADDNAKLLTMLAGFGRGSAVLADVGYTDAILDGLIKDAGDAVLDGATTGDAADDPGDTGPALGEGLAYRIIVDCRDEAHQGELLERLESEGEKCRPLIS